MRLVHGLRQHLLLLLAAALPFVAGAQAPTTGRITGRVIDAASGIGLSDAGVQVVGTTQGTTSGVEGRFTVGNVTPGTVTLSVRRIGYAPKTVTGLYLDAGQTLVQDISLTAATFQLSATVVTADAERGSVNTALDAQRNSVNVVSAVTAEQISRSPDGDAARAIQRVSGVTVQDGKSVFVRGLGERYTVTSMNGARLPSPEPEKRYVPLDLFPSNLLQTINVNKSFTPDLSGDFSGGSVDIRTREFPASRTVAFSSSVGYNDAATGRRVVSAPLVGQEWMGFGGTARALPSGLRTAGSVGSLTTRELMNGAINSLRQVWTPQSATGAPDGSMGISIGGQDPVFGQPVGYLASFSYANSQDVKRGHYEANPMQQDGVPVVLESWQGESGTRNATWGGMMNLSSLFGSGSLITLNNTFTRSADNEARLSEGSAFAFSGGNIQRMTLRFVERAIRSSQLAGEHQVGIRDQLSWSLASAGVRRREPDRSDLVYAQFVADGPYEWSDGNPDVARRTYADLQESNWSANLNFRHAFGEGSDAPAVKVGGAYRNTSREAFNRQFSIISTTVPAADRVLSAEELFDGRYTSGSDDVFNILNVAQDGVYNASERLVAGYAMAEVSFLGRFRLIAGGRVEHARIRVGTDLSNGSTFESELDDTDLLPAALLNVQVGDRSQLRISASQTLARPEYRELSPMQYLEVVGGNITRGNESLVRSLIQNLDVKWELYPDAGEVISVGLFAKRFERPIERIDISTGGQPFVSYFNAHSAQNLGVELELRKSLGSLVYALHPYSVFSNVTLMTSDIDIGDGASANTNANRAMMGQAPWVVNAGLSRSGESGGSMTLLYSAVGPRIHSAGTVPYPDVKEMARHMLDFSFRQPLTESVELSLDLRNLLDAPYRLEQGPVTRESYRTGRGVSLGMRWR
jgi:outer membrane receptor protein involved in Fe transport